MTAGAGRQATGLAAACMAVFLSACASEPPLFVVTQTAMPDAAALPALVVRRSTGAPLLREDWVAAEAAARAHCAVQSMTYARLPPSPDYTQMRLEGRAFAFVARCV